MNTYIDQTENQKGEAVKKLAKELLKSGMFDAVFVPYRTEYSTIPMPSLITDIEKMDNIEPFAPVAPFNAAKQASSVLKYDSEKKIALFLKPCEVRAFTELVKLNQCSKENAVIISCDCMGRMENAGFKELYSSNENLVTDFYNNKELQKEITSTCASCTDFIPKNADIKIGLIGTDQSVFVSITDAGEKVLSNLSSAVGGELALSKGGKIDESAIEALLTERKAEKEKLFAETSAVLKDIDQFQRMIGSCLNCYNCRTACPVCYCKECVFLTDVFIHDPDILFQRSMKKGVLKLPADTTMFHMTRISHIAHSCVGCGQCSSVCPSDIKVADMFRVVSEKNQEKMGYKSGDDPDQPIPYLAYKEVEKNG